MPNFTQLPARERRIYESLAEIWRQWSHEIRNFFLLNPRALKYEKKTKQPIHSSPYSVIRDLASGKLFLMVNKTFTPSLGGHFSEVKYALEINEANELIPCMMKIIKGKGAINLAEEMERPRDSSENLPTPNTISEEFDIAKMLRIARTDNVITREIILETRDPDDFYDTGSTVTFTKCYMPFLYLGRCLTDILKELGLSDSSDTRCEENLPIRLHIARLIIAAMKYYHSFGCAHHDLKAANIVLTSDSADVFTDAHFIDHGHTKKNDVSGQRNDHFAICTLFAGPTRRGDETYSLFTVEEIKRLVAIDPFFSSENMNAFLAVLQNDRITSRLQISGTHFFVHAKPASIPKTAEHGAKRFGYVSE